MITYMENKLISKDFTVEQILQIDPQTAAIFIRLKTDCVGCSLERFCTLEDVATHYELDLETLIDNLQRAIQKNQTTQRSFL